MKKLYLFFCLMAGVKAASSQAAYWQQELHYTIDVSLNDSDNTLDGFLDLRYINHSPDTLTYIWFHVWPNAYKNDRTAYSDQSLENGQTAFYFSDPGQRGYINRLDFRTNGVSLRMEDHPRYIDVLKVDLHSPLSPGDSVEITTPFHVKLPYQFSRSGYRDHFYAICQWYPKPAVYDHEGWHPMPYLDQGEFYGEIGSFDVHITVPGDYVVAATGEQTGSAYAAASAGKPAKGFSGEIKEPETLMKDRKKDKGNGKSGTRKNTSSLRKGSKHRVVAAHKPVAHKHKPASGHGHLAGNKRQVPARSSQPARALPSSAPLKTLHYYQDHIHDFAWFASRDFIVDHDTIQLASGRRIDAYSYYLPAAKKAGEESMPMIRDAVHFRSRLIGEYPYPIVSVVEVPGNPGGMEYPTITLIGSVSSEKELDFTIDHEIGHNWFYGVLATNERAFPWMDEGINTYYGLRYLREKYGSENIGLLGNGHVLPDKLPRKEGDFVLRTLWSVKADQPIALPADSFSLFNYNAIVYFKTAKWMQKLQHDLGTARFDRAMQAYYRQWAFRHPYPGDFRKVMESAGGQDLDADFALLQKKGPLTPPVRKKIRPALLFNFQHTDSITYINFAPAFGYNLYDGFMAGLAIHNYSLPENRFRFLALPLYATGSKQLNGLGHLGYSWYPGHRFQKIAIGVGGGRFSTLDGVDSNGHKVFGGFYRIDPSLRFTWKNRSARSTAERWIEWKTFFIGEKPLNYIMKSSDSLYYPSEGSYRERYLNQLTFQVADYRVLYPYDVQLRVQQGQDFYRASATGHYFFNYAKGGGMQLRFFACKFGYLGGKTTAKEFETSVYQPKLTAVRGDEDYTYSNYFIGRNEYTGLASQQIMMRDGGLKIRTDQFQDLQGRSDNWVASMNFNTTLPNHLFPVRLPIRVFLDVGTYAQAWKKDAPTSRFLYVGGLELTLFNELLNVYAPILYSHEFRDNLKTLPDENKFFKKISFSFDIQRFNLKRLSHGKIPL